MRVELWSSTWQGFEGALELAEPLPHIVLVHKGGEWLVYEEAWAQASPPAYERCTDVVVIESDGNQPEPRIVEAKQEKGKVT